MATSLRYIATMLLMAALCSCATGEDHYSLIPPGSESGRLCAAQCKSAHDSCRVEEDNRARSLYRQCTDSAQQVVRQCEVRAETEFEACERRAQARAEALAKSEAKARAREEARASAEAKSKKGKNTKGKKAGTEKAAKSRKDKPQKTVATEKLAPPEACELKRCVNTATCYDTPAYGMCDTDFHNCYQACGGQVDYLGPGEARR